jgi:hypothetical protein
VQDNGEGGCFSKYTKYSPILDSKIRKKLIYTE